MIKRLIARGKTELHARSAATADQSPPAARADAPFGSSSSAPGAPAPPVVAVLGAKGGAGATTVAVNFAAALCVGGLTTTLVDANLQHPDVAHVVGAEPVHTMMDLLSRSAELDHQLFEACCTEITGGLPAKLNLLSPPVDGKAAITASLSELADCLAGVRSYSRFWVLDLPRHLDKHFVTLADLCDKILLVFEPNVSGIATTQRWLDIFRELGFDEERVLLVLNRAGGKFSGIEQQLETCFPQRSIFRVPNASSVIWESSTRGVPAVAAYPNHTYSKTVAKLAEQVVASVSNVR
jgi:pilus assembly protein CpaE